MFKKVSVVFFILGCLSLSQSILLSVPAASAAQLRDVVISEVAWAGSADSASDEWIELYNNTNQSIDLTNWMIDDDNGAQTYPLQGSIGAHSYLLLESRELSTSLPGDVIKTTSLSNAGDSLVLKDAGQHAIDTVNSTSGTWFAGSATTHATMERTDLQGDGDSATNWHSAATISTATSSNGGHILGSPKATNSLSATGTPSASLTLTSLVMPEIVHNDQDITVSFNIQNASNVSNYGLDVGYDSQQLQFVAANEGSFLNKTTTTSFQAGLLNGQTGTVVIGNARTEKPLTGESGNGTLFNIVFHTTPTATGPSTIEIKSSSFLSTPTAHIDAVQWPTTQLTIQNSTSPSISNLRANPGSERYSILLSWDSPTSGPFEIFRQDSHSQWQLLGTTTNNSFLDHEGIPHGGNIIPQVAYQYRVNTADLITAQTVTGTDNRGLKADNNHSDRVDGSDLEQIARLWTVDDSDSSFQAKVDTNIDGQISGSDLLDLAIDWAKTYQ